MPTESGNRLWTGLMLGGFIAACPVAVMAQSSPHMKTIASPAPNPLPTGAVVLMKLEDAIAIGLRDNRTIKSAYLQRIAQKYDYKISSDPFRPKIVLRAGLDQNRISGGETFTSTDLGTDVIWKAPTGASAGFSWVRRNETGANGAVETTNLTVSQPLLRGAGFDINAAPIERALLQEKQNRLVLRDTVASTVSQIIYAYRRLMTAQEQARLSERALARTKDLLQTNRALIEAGRMAEADIVQTQSSIASQEVALLQSQQALQSAQLSLLSLLALDPRTNVAADDGLSADYVAIDLDKATVQAMSTRADVLAQQNALKFARLDLKLARNDRLWDLSANVVVTHQAYDTPLPGMIEDRGTDVRAGLRLSIPIGDRTLKQREINAAINLKTQELRYQDLTQALEVGVMDAVRRVEASWLQLQAAKRAKALAERAMDIQKEKLKVGRASNYEVLSLEASLQSADVGELTASIAYLDSLTSLDEFLGSTLDTWRIDLND